MTRYTETRPNLERQRPLMIFGFSYGIAHDAHDFSIKLIFSRNIAHGSPHQTLGCK